MDTSKGNGKMVAPSGPGLAQGNLEPSTKSLLRRGRSGDRRALDYLFGRVLSRLRGWAHGRLPRGARNVSDTADVIQDAAAGVWRRLDGLRLDRPGDLDAYIRQAVQNRIHDEARRTRTRPDSVPVDDDLPDTSPSPLECTVRRELFERREELFSLLSPQEREMLIARFEFGYSYEQIAVLLSKPSAAAARMAVNRVLERIRRPAESRTES
jgi:RNA polymerase sigma factor (sigma-70 family)